MKIFLFTCIILLAPLTANAHVDHVGRIEDIKTMRQRAEMEKTLKEFNEKIQQFFKGIKEKVELIPIPAPLLYEYDDNGVVTR